MRIYMCKICKEPIWNFICPDCLAKGIAKWLPPKFSKMFIRFHVFFSKTFKGNLDEFRPCLICRSTDAAPICIDCYMNEVHEWFKDKNPELISDIENYIFHFHFKKHEIIMKKHVFQPIIDNENKEMELGICDECGEYSEELLEANNRLVCITCYELL